MYIHSTTSLRNGTHPVRKIWVEVSQEFSVARAYLRAQIKRPHLKKVFNQVCTGGSIDEKKISLTLIHIRKTYFMWVKGHKVNQSEAKLEKPSSKIALPDTEL